MRRALRISFEDGTSKDLELSKVTAIKADIGMLHFDRLPDKTWRLTYSDSITDGEIKDIKSFVIIRE
jgi:hypothetical protein